MSASTEPSPAEGPKPLQSLEGAPLEGATSIADRAPRSVAFRREREGQWRELDRLAERVLKRGLHSLSAPELEDLPRLYRSALSSLSVARHTALDRALVAYLDALCARAYLALYGSRRTRRGAFRAAFMHDFPYRLRSIWKELLLSCAIMALGGIVAFTLVALDPGWYDTFVAPALANGRDPSASTEELRGALYGAGQEELQGLGALGDQGSLFASYLFVHNARIGILCFALGFAAGIPTAYLLFTNGLMLGAFLQLYASRGLLLPLLGWMLPHGVPEFGAVLLCGAAGLHLGRALIAPGQRRIRDSLAAAGRHAAIITTASVLLFAIAGLIEGIFRQAVVDDQLRFAVAAFNGVWLTGWLLLGGRRSWREAR